MSLRKVNISSEAVALSLSIVLSGRDDIINDEVRLVVQWVVYAVVCEAVDIFGTVTNIINIICFTKLGLNDAINVSLLGLAISDLGCLSTLIFSNLCVNPWFQSLDLPFEPLEFQYLISTWPHVIFARVTSWITALITLERCLCITMPLKVKSIVTPKRVTVTIVAIFVVLICSVSPMYYANSLGWKFVVHRNKTILGLIVTNDREQVETFSYAVNNVVVPFSAFIIIIVCTSTLVLKLKRKAKWREQSTNTAHATATANRDQKITRMVVVISTLFIACFLPVCVLFLAMMLMPGLAVDGKYQNTITVFGGIVLLMESTNSASNIFIYYHMSSKYRAVFRQLFRLAQEVERDKI